MVRPGPVAAVVLAAAALTACAQPAPKPASPPPPTIIGPAPAAATGHIRTDQPVDPDTGYAQPDQWPSACDLLTDADLRSVFPQLTGKVQRKPSERDFGFLDGGRFEVANAYCTLSFTLPGDADGDPATIDTAIEAVGEPDLVAQNAAVQKEAAPDCAYHPAPVQDVATRYVCGGIEFFVDVTPFKLPTRGTGHPDRFQVNGKVTTLDPDASVAALEAEQAFKDTTIEPPLIAAVIQKLPAA